MGETKPDLPAEAESNFRPADDSSQANPPEQLTPSFGRDNVFIGPNGLRRGWRLFLYLAMGSLVFFLLASLRHLILGNHPNGLWAQLYIQSALAAAALIPGFVMSAIEGQPFGNYGLPQSEAFGKSFWIGLLWGIAALTLLMLLMRGVGVFYFGHLALHGARIFRFAAFWGVFFLLVGFFEEFTFRGYTLFTLVGGLQFWPAAILLSLIFGGLHLANAGEAWVGALAAAAIGLLFCFTLRRTGSLWFAVGMHASWDWGESFLYSVPDSGEISTGHLLNSSFHGPRWLTGGSVGPEGSLLVFVVIAIAWLAFDRVYPAKRVT